ncbi:uncharacterized protein METZ01_LOCUS452999, partial [marine metagenome]
MINILYKYLEGIISKKENVFYYNQKKLISGFDNSIYCPHPFTNWSLNPSYTKNNINEHTKEGFRKTADLDSVSEMVGNNIIYCAGGSTTYCTELYPFQKSWPFKLNQLVNDKFKVINAGVGGWGTLQSLIRFMSWGPFFKPRLTVIYQSKNDLTPLYNGRKSEDEIFLQYENIMVQYGLKNPYSFRSMFSRSGGGLAHVYTNKINPSP